MAQGLPTSPCSASSALFLPLRSVMPIGCTGGRYSTSKPIASSSGRNAIRSRNVACVPSPRTERGKSSYQVEKRARTGSTRTARVLSQTEIRGSSGGGGEGPVVASGRLHGIAPEIDQRTDPFDADAGRRGFLFVLAIQA